MASRIIPFSDEVLLTNNTYSDNVSISFADGKTLQVNLKNVATEEYVDSKFSAAMKYTVVDVLPDVGKDNTIYLVKKTAPSTSDVYDEWLYVCKDSESSTYVWEHIGSTEIDLSDYLNKTTDSYIKDASYEDNTLSITKSDNSKVDVDIPDLDDYIKKSNVEGLIKNDGTVDESAYIVNGANDSDVNITVGSSASLSFELWDKDENMGTYHYVDTPYSEDFPLTIELDGVTYYQTDLIEEVSTGVFAPVYINESPTDIQEGEVTIAIKIGDESATDTATIKNITSGSSNTFSVTSEGVFYNNAEIATANDIPEVSNFVEKSETEGLLKNDGTVDTNNYVINGTNDNEVNITVESKIVDTFKYGNYIGKFDETTTTDPTIPSLVLPPTIEYDGVTYYKSTIYDDATHYFPENKYTLKEGAIDMLLYGASIMIIKGGSISNITYVEETPNTITVNNAGAFYNDEEIATDSNIKELIEDTDSKTREALDKLIDSVFDNLWEIYTK